MIYCAKRGKEDILIDEHNIKEFCQPEHYEGQDKILEHLQAGHTLTVSPGIAKDVFTGERHCFGEIQTNGIWEWTSEITYYVRKWNLRLPVEFERFILQPSIDDLIAVDNYYRELLDNNMHRLAEAIRSDKSANCPQCCHTLRRTSSRKPSANTTYWHCECCGARFRSIVENGVVDVKEVTIKRQPRC